jgi:hypothetical protein
MDHIPVGEIASQLPMFIDPTMIVDNVLAGYWDAADALATAPMSVTPRAYGNANAMALLMAAFTEGDRRNRALGYWGAVGSVSQLLGGVNVPLASSRSPRHARATSPSESGDQRDTHGSYRARVRLSAPMPRTTSALRRRERCTMPRRRTSMCRAPMCGPRTWLTDQSHEMGDGQA